MRCITVDMFVLECELFGPQNGYTVIPNPMVGRVRPVTGMELGQRAKPNSRPSRSVELLWHFMITS